MIQVLVENQNQNHNQNHNQNQNLNQNQEPQPEPGIEAQPKYLVNNGSYITTTPILIVNLSSYHVDLNKIDILNGLIGGNGVVGSNLSIIDKFINSDNNIVPGVFLIGQWCYEYDTSQSNFIDNNEETSNDNNITLNISHQSETVIWYTAIIKCTLDIDSYNNLEISVNEAGRVEDWVSNLNNGWNSKVDYPLVTTDDGDGYGLFNVTVNLVNTIYYSWEDLKQAIDNYKNNESFYGNMSTWDVSNVTNMYGLFQGYEFDGSENIDGWDVSNVVNMSYMFANSNFDRDISRWKVSEDTILTDMFIYNNEMSSKYGVTPLYSYFNGNEPEPEPQPEPQPQPEPEPEAESFIVPFYSYIGQASQNQTNGNKFITWLNDNYTNDAITYSTDYLNYINFTSYYTNAVSGAPTLPLSVFTYDKYNKYMNCFYYSSTYGNSTYPGNLIMTFTKQGTVQIVWGNGYDGSTNSNNIVSLYLNGVLKEQATSPALDSSQFQILSRYQVYPNDVVKIEEYNSLILLYEMIFYEGGEPQPEPNIEPLLNPSEDPTIVEGIEPQPQPEPEQFFSAIISKIRIQRVIEGRTAGAWDNAIGVNEIQIWVNNVNIAKNSTITLNPDTYASYEPKYAIDNGLTAKNSRSFTTYDINSYIDIFVDNILLNDLQSIVLYRPYINSTLPLLGCQVELYNNNDMIYKYPIITAPEGAVFNSDGTTNDFDDVYRFDG